MAGVFDAASSGNRIELLTALRDSIAYEIDAGVPARDLASLSRRLIDISNELEAARTEEEGDDIDDAASIPDEGWPA